MNELKSPETITKEITTNDSMENQKNNNSTEKENTTDDSLENQNTKTDRTEKQNNDSIENRNINSTEKENTTDDGLENKNTKTESMEKQNNDCMHKKTNNDSMDKENTIDESLEKQNTRSDNTEKQNNDSGKEENTNDSCMQKQNSSSALLNGHSYNMEPAANVEDPFDLSNDHSQETETYKPLKRKLNCCTSLPEESFGKVGSLSQNSGDVAVPTECSDDDKDTDMSSLDAKRVKTSQCVTYVHSAELLRKTNELVRIEKRAELVHSLIEVYGLLQYIEVLPPRHATESEILGFHCPDYIDCLRGVSSCTDSEDIPETLSSTAEGYAYDCPQQHGILDTASLISGATITAAKSLLNGSANIAINWYGGWHHAKRDSASGFCYINDIVLGILKLREKYDRILYVDLDLHHGDGVEEAFEMTSKVMTVSFHKFSTGFFPGSGSLDSVGIGRGKFYSVNVPLKDGIKNAEFFEVFCRVMNMVKEKFHAQALVVQCGADSLSQDPMASFNLTHIGLARCVCFLLAWNLPTLLLGGGGYNFPDTAKCWTFLTALAARKKLPMDIPEHEHFLEYGPGYEMTTSVGNRKDCNSKEYLDSVISTISKNLSNL